MKTPGVGGFDLDYLAILRGVWRRHKRLMAGIFLGVALPAAAVVYYTSYPAYISTALITIESPILDQVPQFREFARRESLGNLLILLQSRSFAAAVIEALPKESFEELITKPLHTDYMLVLQNKIKEWLGKPPVILSPQERAINELQNARVEFIQSPQTVGVLTFRGTASSPRVAMDLVNAYLQVLLSRTRSTNQEEARKTREFLEQQVQQIKDSLTQAENNLSKFQQQKGRIRLGEQTEFDLDTLSKLESALAEAQASREVTWAQISVMRQSLDKGRGKSGKGPIENQGTERDEPSGVGSPTENLARLNAFKAAQERLARLEAKLATLRERYTEAHPLVQSTQQEVITEQSRVTQLARDIPAISLNKEPRGLRSVPLPQERADAQQQLASLETEEAGLQAKIETLKIQVDRLRKNQNLRNLGHEEVEFSSLRRTAEVNRNLFTVLTDKLMNARIREQGEVGALRIVDPALFPVQPTRSRYAKSILMVLVLAGGLAFGAAFGIEFWRQPVETEEDVLKATGLSVLGSVGVIEGPVVETKTRQDDQSTRLPVHLPNSKVHLELYRAIRATIETERLKTPFRSILVNSPGPSEGKSTTVLNLAHVFQELGRRVLVVECDLRRPVLYRTLALTNKPGLADFLRNTATFEDVCRSLPSGITVIPGQVVRDDPATVLASPRFKDLLYLAHSKFDLVLVDSAPILAVPDNLLLVAAVDQIILVVKASATSRRDLCKAQTLLQKANARILGVVLNQANRRDVYYYHRKYRKYYPPTNGRGSQESSRPHSFIVGAKRK